jgi:hypothetical protein
LQRHAELEHLVVVRCRRQGRSRARVGIRRRAEDIAGDVGATVQRRAVRDGVGLLKLQRSKGDVGRAELDVDFELVSAGSVADGRRVRCVVNDSARSDEDVRLSGLQWLH